MDLEVMRVERKEWQARNFPGNDAVLDCALGTAEEVGELTHHFLKKKQGIRGTAEEHDAEMKDAIGDLLVFLMGVCDGAVVNPDVARRQARFKRIYATPEQALGGLAFYVGRIVNTGTCARFTVIDALHIGQVIILAERFCVLHGWDFDAIVQDTWDHVKQRDWTKDKATGGNESVAPALSRVPIDDYDPAED